MEAGDRGQQEVRTSEGSGIVAVGVPQPAGDMLKKRKEVMEALDLMFPTKRTAKEAQPDEAGKKIRKVVKKSVPQHVIDSIIAKPCMMGQDLSDQDLADKPQQFVEAYSRAKFLGDNFRVYEQALIDQYRLTGYAYDEIEVTDDDDEGENKITGDEDETEENS